MYQFSILTSLMAGVAKHGVPVSKVAAKAGSEQSIGLGTYSMMKGELVHLNGTTYQQKGDGTVSVASPEMVLPFVMVTKFAPTHFYDNVQIPKKAALDGLLLEAFPHCDQLFVSYRLTGKFKHIKARAVHGQEYEGQPLAEVADKQAVFEFNDISGTVVGFRSPMSWQGLSVAGQHLHFISEDRKKGGHILELVTEKGVRVEAALVKVLQVELPTGQDFNDADLSVDHAGIAKVEG